MWTTSHVLRSSLQLRDLQNVEITSKLLYSVFSLAVLSLAVVQMAVMIQLSVLDRFVFVLTNVALQFQEHQNHALSSQTVNLRVR